MDNKYDQCKECKRWVLFQYEDLNPYQRKQTCPKCLIEKVSDIRQVEFENREDGMWRRTPWRDWEKVEEVIDEEGWHLKSITKGKDLTPPGYIKQLTLKDK